MSNDQGNKKQGDATDSDGPMVGARHENSVLFTLSDLNATAAAQPRGRKKPRQSIQIDNEEEDASGYININHAGGLFGGGGGGGSEPSQAPAGHANDDASGFINIGNIASMGGGGPAPNPGQATADPNAAPMPMIPGAIPMGTRESNKGVQIAIGVSVALLLVAIVALVLVWMNRGDKEQTLIKEMPAPTATAQAGGDKAAPAGDKAAAAPDEDDDDKDEAQDNQANADDGDADKDGDDKDNADKDDADKDAVADKKGDDKDKKPSAKDKTKTKKPAAAANDKPKDGADKQDKPAEDAKPVAEDKKPAAAANDKPKDNMDRILDDLGGGDKKPKSNLPASLSRSQVKAVVGRHRGRAVACGGGGRSGTVIVRFTIMPSGGVSGAAVSNDKRGTSEGNCVLGVVRSMKFPAFSGSPMTINFPFVLP